MLKLAAEEKHREKPKKLRLSFYPYTYVRTTVMRTLLLKEDHYNKILKMDFNEIARFLEETTYKRSIDRLASRLSGAELIDAALNSDLAESFAKLRRISSDELRLLIDEYLKRKDIEDIKTILRGKFTKAEDKIIENSLQAVGVLSREFLVSLIKKESVESVLKILGPIGFLSFKKPIEALKKEDGLAEIENELDRQYYDGILEFAQSLPRQGGIFRDFLVREIEIKNLLAVLKLKKAGIDKNKIQDFLFLTDNLNYKNLLLKLANSDISSMPKLLEKSDYKELIKSGLKSYEATGSLIELEASLYKYLLKRSVLLLHQNPLSIDVILGYMFAKDIEVKNLKLIVKAKQLGLDNDFIEKQMVF